ncbi:MAG: bifunctional riboflavin kinase/FAD synthetase [Alphaproteobacteria bacterium]|nr:bifunctional riboflavin kinase/FAD synthetase [Alphaproteobacteria bacterium]
MRIYDTWRGLPAEARGASVALGNFDGVHLGHASLIHAAHAARPDVPRAVLTFEPHPRELFRPEDPPFRLTLAAERADALARLGVTILYQLPFDRAFSRMSAGAFIADVLAAGIGARHLACGPDFAFGFRRGGDAAMLAARAEALGIGLTVAPLLSDEQGLISSTRIRRLLQDGYPERAAAVLGRVWTIRGVVQHGEKLGRTIGFPTANIALGPHLEPARGVYAATVRMPDGSERPGVANVGRRPTIAPGLDSLLEVFLFDFSGDLYGAELTVALRSFLRPERKYPSIEEMAAQIARDAAEARQIGSVSV